MKLLCFCFSSHCQYVTFESTCRKCNSQGDLLCLLNVNISTNQCISKQPTLMRPNTRIWILRLLFCQCKPVKVKKKSVLDENLGLVSQIHGRSLCVKPTPHFWILKRSYKLLRCAESFIFPVKIKCPLSKYSLV